MSVRVGCLGWVERKLATKQSQTANTEFSHLFVFLRTKQAKLFAFPSIRNNHNFFYFIPIMFNVLFWLCLGASSSNYLLKTQTMDFEERICIGDCFNHAGWYGLKSLNCIRSDSWLFKFVLQYFSLPFFLK